MSHGTKSTPRSQRRWVAVLGPTCSLVIAFAGWLVRQNLGAKYPWLASDMATITASVILAVAFFGSIVVGLWEGKEKEPAPPAPPDPVASSVSGPALTRVGEIEGGVAGEKGIAMRDVHIYLPSEQSGSSAGGALAPSKTPPLPPREEPGTVQGVGVISTSTPEYSYLEEPLLVSSKQGNLQMVDSGFIVWEQCTVMIWVLVPLEGQGLRNAPHNRYLIAHHTGQKDDRNNYNLFALRYTGERKWEVVFSNDRAIGDPSENLKIDDGLKPGWHQFLIAWDHVKPSLVFSIDRGRCGNALSPSYTRFWPSHQKGSVTVGAWPRPTYPDSYCETYLYRMLIFNRFLGVMDPVVKEHFEHPPRS